MDAAADSPVNAAPTLGQALAAEREKQGLSRADVAQRLHMSAYQVEALESGDFTRLPQGTFLRGFVRNYAKVLGLQPDSMVAMLGDGPGAERRPGIVVPTESIRFDPLGERFASPYVKAITIAFVVIALGFAAMYWWLFIRPTPPGAVAHKTSQAVTSAPAPAPMAPPPEPSISSAPVMVATAPAMPPAEPEKKPEPVKAAPEPAKPEATKKTESGKATPAAASPAPAAKPAQATGNTLKFVFKGQSWVEVRDAKNRLIFSRLNAPGSDAEVSGTPPFNVVVGNAPEVQLFYNDHEFDLEPHTKVAVARFTVE